LERSFNPEASRIIESIDQEREIILNQANISLFSGGIQVEPTFYHQAWDHQDPEDHENGEMQSRKSWATWRARRFGKPSRKKMFQ
jgi:hypothetical protein